MSMRSFWNQFLRRGAFLVTGVTFGLFGFGFGQSCNYNFEPLQTGLLAVIAGAALYLANNI
jgi:hypothetical protein